MELELPTFLKPGLVIIADESSEIGENMARLEVSTLMINAKLRIHTNFKAHPRFYSDYARNIVIDAKGGGTEVVWITEPTMMLAFEVWVRELEMIENTTIYFNRDHAMWEKIPFDELSTIYASFVKPFTELKVRRAALIDD